MMRKASVFVFIHKAQSSPFKDTQKSPTTASSSRPFQRGISLGHDGGDTLEERRGGVKYRRVATRFRLLFHSGEMVRTEAVCLGIMGRAGEGTPVPFTSDDLRSLRVRAVTHSEPWALSSGNRS